MSIDSTSHKLKLVPSWPIILSGAGLGAVLAWGVLSGDAQGRVNLFYLLFVYLFIPIFSLIVSSISLLSGKGVNLARLLTQLPVWSKQASQIQRKLRQLEVEKFWLYFQSNLAALAYAATSIIILFVLLIASDINFVWRSTILTADDLLPFLQLIALPWSFWEQAQPSMSLIEMTQDSRLHSQQINTEFGAWWRFVLAVQIFYGFLLRGLCIVLTALWFKWKLAADVETQLSNLAKTRARESQNSNQLAEVTQQISGSQSKFTNWCGIDVSRLNSLTEIQINQDNLMNAGPLASESEQRVAERWQGPQVVIVKAWEPPMAELFDFLQNGHGVVFPVDWNDSELQPIRLAHLQEWQRFVAQLNDWQVFIPHSLMPKENP